MAITSKAPSRLSGGRSHMGRPSFFDYEGRRSCARKPGEREGTLRWELRGLHPVSGHDRGQPEHSTRDTGTSPTGLGGDSNGPPEPLPAAGPVGTRWITNGMKAAQPTVTALGQSPTLGNFPSHQPPSGTNRRCPRGGLGWPHSRPRRGGRAALPRTGAAAYVRCRLRRRRATLKKGSTCG